MITQGSCRAYAATMDSDKPGIPDDDFAFLTVRAGPAEMAARANRACGMTAPGTCFVSGEPGLSCAGRCLNADTARNPGQS
jgi:hypothetical protein